MAYREADVRVGAGEVGEPTADSARREPRPPAAVRGPAGSAERALAPDLARGGMLLFIALVNSAVFALGREPGVRPAAEIGPLDGAVTLVMLTLVNARAYPVFAFMFGYGLVQLTLRQTAAGAPWPAVRRLLLRRNASLIVVGAAHAVVLYAGDIASVYGLIGLAVTLLLLRRRERTLRVVVGAYMALTLCSALVAAALVLAAAGPGAPSSEVLLGSAYASLTAPDYWSGLLARLREWPQRVGLGLTFLPVVLLGVVAAHHRLLEEPERHRRLLAAAALVGLPAAFLGGLPAALASVGAFAIDHGASGAAATLHGASGIFAGPGYVALFALLASRLRPVMARADLGAPARLARGAASAVAALGRRSLSGYVLQSAAYLALFSPYALALGERTGEPAVTAAAVGLLVWLATVAGAAALESRSLAGPAEWLLRRLAYGSKRTPRRAAA
jgi:uncharacterized membrane protein YeiB